MANQCYKALRSYPAIRLYLHRAPQWFPQAKVVNLGRCSGIGEDKAANALPGGVAFPPAGAWVCWGRSSRVIL